MAHTGSALTGTPLSGGGVVGRQILSGVFLIDRPAPSTPSAGASIKSDPSSGNGGGGVGVSPCQDANGGRFNMPGERADGSRKRSDFGPVVALNSEVMPHGFKVGAFAWGGVVPEGR